MLTLSDEEVLRESKNNGQKNTIISTKWAGNTFNDWVVGKAAQNPNFAGITAENLVISLSGLPLLPEFTRQPAPRTK